MRRLGKKSKSWRVFIAYEAPMIFKSRLRVAGLQDRYIIFFTGLRMIFWQNMLSRPFRGGSTIKVSMPLVISEGNNFSHGPS